MSKPKMPPGTPDDTEAAFYEALRQADIDRLMACWADEDDIVCVQPGGPRLLGPAAVRAAFEGLFARGAVVAQHEHVRRLEAGHCRVHSVLERVAVQGAGGEQVAWVVATNVFVKTSMGWRMVVHHASPGSGTEPVEVAGARPLLH